MNNHPLAFLRGYKTYIMAACGLLTIGTYAIHKIDAQTATMLLGMFGFGGIAALRSAVSKSVDSVLTNLPDPSALQNPSEPTTPTFPPQ
jgi:hypothetical protein